jgi:hypothetical protein
LNFALKCKYLYDSEYDDWRECPNESSFNNGECHDMVKSVNYIFVYKNPDGILEAFIEFLLFDSAYLKPTTTTKTTPTTTPTTTTTTITTKTSSTTEISSTTEATSTIETTGIAKNY